MTDRLERIKINRCKSYVGNSDVDWLVDEVERLRAARITDQPPVSGDLEAIFTRSSDRDAATKKKI